MLSLNFIHSASEFKNINFHMQLASVFLEFWAGGIWGKEKNFFVKNSK